MFEQDFERLTADRGGDGVDLFGDAEAGRGRGVRSAEGHRHGCGVGSLDLVGLGGDDRVVAFVSGQNRSRDGLVGSVGRPARGVDRVSRRLAG